MNEEHTKTVLQSLDGLFNEHFTPDTDTKPILKIGGHYNWKHTPQDKLIYLGKPGSWNQFKKIGDPREVWCEVLDEDMHLLEETVVAADVVGDAGESDGCWGPDPMQEIFEITPTHARQVGTIGHTPSRRHGKTAMLNAYMAIAAASGMFAGVVEPQQYWETFYEKLERIKGPNFPQADHDRFDAAEAKRQRKNAKRLNNSNQQARV